MRTSEAAKTTTVLTALCVLHFVGLPPAAAQFSAHNVSLHSWIDLGTFGANSGNDCWGYVSASGREYALMGLSNKMAVVEITDPANPNWFASVAHAGNLWCDVKVYQDHAYIVTEGGSGIQVVDLSDIDNHVIALVRTIASPASSHNVVIDTDSGFLYAADGAIFDLSAPANPARVGTGPGWHDAQVVTYASGPYAGREIMFASHGGAGMGIIDVTNKSSTFGISLNVYPNLSYCHQAWTEDLNYLYINDELDSIPRTIVLDISDLDNPVYAGEFSSGLPSVDHNNYVLDGILYSANYHSGLRIFDVASNPINAPEIGWFDTFPENNGGGFDGAWSVYPFFPSGTVIVSDMNRGLFILDVSATSTSLIFEYPNGRPEIVNPAGGTAMRVVVTGRNIDPRPDSGLLHYNSGAGWLVVPMTTVSPNVYDAVFPAAPCPQEVLYYVSAEAVGGEIYTNPAGAPANRYSAIARYGETVLFADNFEMNLGWSTENLGATTGDWQRGVPVNDPGWPYDPISDSDGSGQCFVTQNELGNTDVDDGAVRLTSPVFDMSQGGIINYDYFLKMTSPAGVDRLLVEVSDDGGGSWTEIARHETDGGLSWRTHSINEADLSAAGVALTATMRMRYTANDSDPQSIVEAGLDAFRITIDVCDPPFPPGDLNCDGALNGGDIDPFFLALGNPAAYTIAFPNCDAALADMNGDGLVNGGDIDPFFACLGGGVCP